MTGEAQGVLRSLGAVERAYKVGDVRRLCRPGALVDPAVIRAQDAKRTGCKAELESLMSRCDHLATADVSVAGGPAVPVDFVRRQGGWLLSFSDGGDPMPALAGAQ